MKAGTLAGILLGTVAIFGAFLWEGGTLDSLILLPAMLIVLGGTFAAGLAGSNFEQIKRLPILFKIALFPEKFDRKLIVGQILYYSSIARREGILALDRYVEKAKHPYLKRLIGICIDGVDPDSLQEIVETELEFLGERHNRNIGFFHKLGGYSPTMGIIGTVMGLIATLAAAGSDPNELIHHIASAFIATLWGIFLANIVWFPLGDKLKMLHEDEVNVISLILEGVKGLQLGETPTIIYSRLATAFSLKEQEDLRKLIRLREDPAISANLEQLKSASNNNGTTEGVKKPNKEVVKETQTTA